MCAAGNQSAVEQRLACEVFSTAHSAPVFGEVPRFISFNILICEMGTLTTSRLQGCWEEETEVIWHSEGALTTVSSGCPGHDLVMDHAVTLCFPTPLPQQNRLCRPRLLGKAQLEKNLHYNPGCCGHSLKKKKNQTT